MSLALKAVYYSLIGGWGGFLAWVLLDPVLHVRPTNPYTFAIVNGAIVGVCIGGLVVSFESLMERRIGAFGRGMLLGGAAGLAGGVVSLLVGEALFQALHQNGVWRVAAWAIFGLGIGAADGMVSRSARRTLQGALGGTVGGILGGITFHLLRSAADLPMTSRALGFVLLGLFIGLFIGLVQVVLREATLMVVSSGPQEGKEYSLTNLVTEIGRDDRCDVGLYYDRQVDPKHAVIRQENRRFVLAPAQPGLALAVNGQQVVRHQLADRDHIHIGEYRLVFREKKCG